MWQVVELKPFHIYRSKAICCCLFNCFIFDVADYAIIEQGLRLFKMKIKSMPCTGCAGHYLKNIQCGPVTSQQWRGARIGIMKAMVGRLKLSAAVQNRASHTFGFTTQLGWGFVASVVEQGRFEL